MAKGTGFGKALPKNFRKVKSGYDQAFTLPKGTSAAPIKQATSYKPPKVTAKHVADTGVIFGAGVAVGAITTKKSKKSKRPKGGWTPGA